MAYAGRWAYDLTVIRLLISTGVFLASAAVGLLAANSLLDGMSLDALSFVIVVVIFAMLQAVLSPFLTKIAMRNAPAVLGGVGLLSTFVALLITSLVTSGLTISGFDTWVFASLIVWIVTMLATLLLPLLVVKRVVTEKRTS